MDFHKPHHGVEFHQAGWRIHPSFIQARLILVACFIAFTLSAAEPPAYAEYRLAHQLYSGSGGTQDTARAVILFEQAAEAGQREAQLKLGVLYESGIGYRRDLQAAAGWYFKAANQGQPVAQTRLGILLTQPAEFDQALRLDLGTNSFTCPDYEAAAQWLRAAADQDYPIAQFLLGDLVPVYFTKKIGDRSTSTRWLLSAHGDSGAWYAKAANGGMPEAILRAAQAYFAAGGKYGEAYQWYLRAQQDGIPGATEALEKLEPHLLTSTRLAAQRALREIKLSTPKDWSAWHELVHHRNPGPTPRFAVYGTNDFILLQQQATAGDAVAQFNLGLAWQHEEVWFAGRIPVWKGVGQPLIPVAETRLARGQEAAKWYALAAAKGHRDAQFHLAMMLRYPTAGKSDLSRAQQLFQAAADSGHRDAQYELALMLDEGFVGMAQPAQATKWLQQAAAADNIAAKSALQRRASVSGSNQVSLPPKPSQKPRLAILTMQPELQNAADILLVEMGKHQGVQMVERSEIERILKEQTLSASGVPDYLKTGQLLRADGLLILEVRTTGQTQNLGTRLVAVGPGIVLGQVEVAWPINDQADWVQNTTSQFSRFWDKLTVTQREAVPVSLLNLRSAVASPEAAGLDRQLTVFLKHRLMRERELFVLERSRLEQLVQEKDLTSGAASRFWGGSYLLEGVLNREGVKAGELSIHLRVTSPGRKITEFTRSGPADQPEQLLEQLARLVVREMAQGVRHLEWNPDEEAKQYFTEAQWLYRQEMYPEAQQASEAAWALGLRNHDAVTLRIQAYAQGVKEMRYDLRKRSLKVSADERAAMVQAQQEKLIMALNLYIQQTNQTALATLNTNQVNAWVTMGGGLVTIAGGSLSDATAVTPELRKSLLPQLAQTRELSRSLIQWLIPRTGQMESAGEARFLETIVEANALFHESMADAAKQLRGMVLTGLLRRSQDAGRLYDSKVKLTLWSESPTEQASLGVPYEQVFRELLEEGSPQVREDILLWRLSGSRSLYEFENVFLLLGDLLWEQRDVLVENGKLQELWKRAKKELERRQIFDPIWQRLNTDDLPALQTQLQPWLAKQDQRQEELRKQATLQARQRAEEESLKRRQQMDERMKQMREQMSQRLKQSQQQKYVELVELLKTADRAIPDLIIYLGLKLTEEQAKELKPLMAAYRDRVGGDQVSRMLEQRVAIALKEEVQKKEPFPSYLRGLSTELPDWKSAHMSWAPMRYYQPMNMASHPATGAPLSGFPPGMFPPGSGPGPLPPGTSTPAAALQEKNVLVLDTFWRPPVRMGTETDDMVSGIRMVDVWENELLIEVLRVKSPGLPVFGRNSFLRLRLDDMKVEMVTPSESVGHVLPAQGIRFVRVENHLYGIAKGGIVRHSLATREWDFIPLALPEFGNLLAVPPYLLLHNREGLYQVELGSRTLKILASTRRRPAETALDELPELNLSQASSLGDGKAVVSVSRRLFLLDVTDRKWNEMNAPQGFNSKIKILGGEVFCGFSERTSLQLHGFARRSPEGGKFEPFLRAGPKYLVTGNGSLFGPATERLPDPPRWVFPPDIGFYPPAMDLLLLDDSLLVQYRPGDVFTTSNVSPENFFGQFYLCVRGLAEPIRLTLETPPESAKFLRATTKPAISLYSTKNHVVVLPEGNGGLWLISKAQIEQAAAGAKVKLKEQLQQQIAAEPTSGYLRRIQDEKKPY